MAWRLWLFSYHRYDCYFGITVGNLLPLCWFACFRTCWLNCAPVTHRIESPVRTEKCLELYDFYTNLLKQWCGDQAMVDFPSNFLRGHEANCRFLLTAILPNKCHSLLFRFVGYVKLLGNGYWIVVIWSMGLSLTILYRRFSARLQYLHC